LNWSWVNFYWEFCDFPNHELKLRPSSCNLCEFAFKIFINVLIFFVFRSPEFSRPRSAASGRVVVHSASRFRHPGRPANVSSAFQRSQRGKSNITTFCSTFRTLKLKLYDVSIEAFRRWKSSITTFLFEHYNVLL